jgi:hypothetical protein
LVPECIQEQKTGTFARSGAEGRKNAREHSPAVDWTMHCGCIALPPGTTPTLYCVRIMIFLFLSRTALCWDGTRCALWSPGVWWGTQSLLSKHHAPASGKACRAFGFQPLDAPPCSSCSCADEPALRSPEQAKQGREEPPSSTIGSSIFALPIPSRRRRTKIVRPACPASGMKASIWQSALHSTSPLSFLRDCLSICT